MIGDSLAGTSFSRPIPESCTTKQASATEQAFNLARQNRNALNDTINFLEEKLKPIVRPEQQSVEVESSKDEIEPVMLVASIRDIAKDFAVFNKRIKSLIERLEI